MQNPTELLESFEKELANEGKWYWTGNNGSKARIITAMQKMLKANMDYHRSPVCRLRRT